MDPNLESNCDHESVFVQHNEHEDKDVMMIAILRNLHAQKKIDTSSKSFKIWFFDDEGSNRKKVADSQAKYTSVLATQVQTCAFSPSKSFKIWFFDDEGSNRKKVADSQA